MRRKRRRTVHFGSFAHPLSLFIFIFFRFFYAFRSYFALLPNCLAHILIEYKREKKRGGTKMRLKTSRINKNSHIFCHFHTQRRYWKTCNRKKGNLKFCGQNKSEDEEVIIPTRNNTNSGQFQIPHIPHVATCVRRPRNTKYSKNCTAAMGSHKCPPPPSPLPNGE